MRDIGKDFPGVRALSGVSLTLAAGEVHALVGENGAGKSTLMKILAGALPADTGEIFVDGTKVEITAPRQAEKLGIGMIYQEFNLVPYLNAAANLVLGNEPERGIFLDERKAKEIAEKAFADLGASVPLDVETSRLSIAQQQMIEIAKILARQARIIVMDEPSAALTDREIDRLFNLIRALKARGAGIIYISHRLEELPQVADRITVLRDGQVIESRPAAQFPTDDVIRAMVGRTFDAHFPELPPVAQDAPVVLAVENLTRKPAVNGVSFQVRAGEVVGLAGLIGAGRSEIVRAIAGADIAGDGEIAIAGHALHLRGPADGIDAGLAFITEDRKAQGLILGMTVRENITLAHLKEFVARYFLIDRKKETQAAQRSIEELHIRTPSTEQTVGNLSGGNQQKVVLGKWLLGETKVFLFDEPTRGIDIGAKTEIYSLMLRLLKGGAGIVMVSSELPEAIGMSHRLLVIRGGRVVLELNRAQATPEAVIAAATGAAA